MTAEIDAGPLTGLIGTWAGDSGMDVAPEPDGPDDNPYHETITFRLVEDVVENAEEQELVALHYHQVVRRKRNDKVFHDQTGYWMWEPATGLIMQSLVLPRGMGLLAGGRHCVEGSATIFEVAAGERDADWPVMQSGFMKRNARTLGYMHRLVLDGDSLAYSQTTDLDIYGRAFAHTDQNSLTRV